MLLSKAFNWNNKYTYSNSYSKFFLKLLIIIQCYKDVRMLGKNSGCFRRFVNIGWRNWSSNILCMLRWYALYGFSSDLNLEKKQRGDRAYQFDGFYFCNWMISLLGLSKFKNHVLCQRMSSDTLNLLSPHYFH